MIIVENTAPERLAPSFRNYRVSRLPGRLKMRVGDLVADAIRLYYNELDRDVDRAEDLV